MNNFVAELESQLVAAATRQNRRRIVRMRATAALAALACVCPAGAVASGLWSPQIGDGSRPAPGSASSEVPSAEQAQLSVLRRDQTDTDRRDAVEALHYTALDVDGVRSADIRSIPVGGKIGHIVLIPVERYGLSDTSTQVGKTVAPRRAAGRNGLCIFAADTSGGSGGLSNCFSADDLAAGRATGAVGREWFGLVPDGVESVRVTTVGAGSAQYAVRSNAVSFPNPPNGEREMTIEWLSAGGTTLRSYTTAPLPTEQTEHRCDSQLSRAECEASGRDRELP